MSKRVAGTSTLKCPLGKELPKAVHGLFVTDEDVFGPGLEDADNFSARVTSKKVKKSKKRKAAALDKSNENINVKGDEIVTEADLFGDGALEPAPPKPKKKKKVEKLAAELPVLAAEPVSVEAKGDSRESIERPSKLPVRGVRKRTGPALIPGTSVKPMLAKPTKGIGEVLERVGKIGKFTCEWKYDGERAQVHVKNRNQICVFSRNLKDSTEKYPDIVVQMRELLDHPDCSMTDCIIDCEAVAYDRKTNEILPFQRLATRKKKNANINDLTVQICIFVFDLLHINGETIVEDTFFDRREIMRYHFPEIPGKFLYARGRDCTTEDQIQEELDRSIEGGCEGLMVKTLLQNATYKISSRTKDWLKLKKDYLDGVGDTLDLVPIGGWIGNGKRSHVFGAFLLACKNEKTGKFQSVCKVGTGFTDADLQHFKIKLDQLRITRPLASYQYTNKGTEINNIIWFEPKYVWEVKCADLTLSPIYQAGIGRTKEGRGISLRFPRYLRTRTDKDPDDATNAAQILEMYHNQSTVK